MFMALLERLKYQQPGAGAGTLKAVVGVVGGGAPAADALGETAGVAAIEGSVGGSGNTRAW